MTEDYGKLVKQLRAGHQYSGVTYPHETKAADAIKQLLGEKEAAEPAELSNEYHHADALLSILPMPLSGEQDAA